MADENDDLFDSVSSMAERIGLKGKERERYIHEHMTRSGYRAVPQYVLDDSEDEDEEDEGGFFGGRSSARRRRPTRDQESGGHGTGTRRRRGRDDEDWYS